MKLGAHLIHMNYNCLMKDVPENTKRVIRICKSKRNCNGKQKIDKRTNNDTTLKTKHHGSNSINQGRTHVFRTGK